MIFQTEYNHYKLFISPFLDGRISKERIDDAVSRVLRAKFELGLFEKPYTSEKEITELKKINNKPLAEKAAIESFVLLQNNNTLPINDNYKNSGCRNRCYRCQIRWLFRTRVIKRLIF